MPSVSESIEASREQLRICRYEITLGAKRLRADQEPSLEDTHLMAAAILEYFDAQLALEATEAAAAHAST